MSRTSAPSDVDLRRFAGELRDLRLRAGNPGYRQLTERTRFGRTVLSEALNGTRLPSWEVTRALVLTLGGDEREWRERWALLASGAERSRPADAGPTGRPSVAARPSAARLPSARHPHRPAGRPTQPAGTTPPTTTHQPPAGTTARQLPAAARPTHQPPAGTTARQLPAAARSAAATPPTAATRSMPPAGLAHPPGHAEESRSRSRRAGSGGPGPDPAGIAGPRWRRPALPARPALAGPARLARPVAAGVALALAVVAGALVLRPDAAGPPAAPDTRPGARSAPGEACFEVTAQDVRVFTEPRGQTSWSTWRTGIAFWAARDAAVPDRLRVPLRNGSPGWVTANPRFVRSATGCG